MRSAIPPDGLMNTRLKTFSITITAFLILLFFGADLFNLSHAATDARAAGRFGHERSVAVGSELDKMLINVKKALANIKIGKYGLCENCGKMIDTDRLAIDPTASVCVECAKKSSGK